MRLLLTFSDWHTGRTQASHGDPGPIRRLLAVGGVAYDEVRLFAVKRDRPAARALAAELGHGGVLAEVSTLDVTDPSDYAQLFHALSGVPARLPPDAEVDVLLSSGTPQAQTIWVVLVKAGLLRARLLQVIPPQFVPDPHPEPVREVRLDFDGFPEIRALREEVVRLRARVRAVSGRLVGESEALRRVAEGIARLAPTPLPVLITGETGTGKELVARALHDASTRADGPFIAENCGALAEGVLQSELFGHEAGAFTGAAKRRRGLFEQAAGGTLFLDEVGELPARVQVQLLRVLQEGVLRRVGGDEAVPVDARIVAATHRDLPAMVAAGTFREDLYYRLNGATLHVPPLRDRLADLEPLVAHFLSETDGAHLRLTRAAWAALRAWRWPGNARELRAEVARWTVFCDGLVDVGDLSIPHALAPLAAGGPPAPTAESSPGAGAGPRGRPSTPENTNAAPATLAEHVSAAERAAIADALAATNGNLSAAARRLGIDRNTLKRKQAAFGWRGAQGGRVGSARP
jgi:DNA-binding NtrC family response regulator